MIGGGSQQQATTNDLQSRLAQMKAKLRQINEKQ
jgi:hypothetical protein